MRYTRLIGARGLHEQFVLVRYNFLATSTFTLEKAKEGEGTLTRDVHVWSRDLLLTSHVSYDWLS